MRYSAATATFKQQQRYNWEKNSIHHSVHNNVDFLKKLIYLYTLTLELYTQSSFIYFYVG